MQILIEKKEAKATVCVGLITGDDSLDVNIALSSTSFPANVACQVCN